MRVARSGARVLLVDPGGRVLLIHEYLQPRGEAGTQWITPGGGIEDGESPLRAAEREAWEETGLRITLPADAEPVHRTTRLWDNAETEFEQDDRFYLVRTDAEPLLRAAAQTDSEQELFIGFGWWSAAELLATEQQLVPPELGSVLQRVLGD